MVAKSLVSKELSPLEIELKEAFIATQKNIPELKAIRFDRANEIDIGNGKKAIVVYIPVASQAEFRKHQQKATRELEKKFSDRRIVFVGNRRIIPKPRHDVSLKQPRPRSYTLTAVHNAILEDIVYPAEIAGKSTRVKVDGSKVIKVLLNSQQETELEGKVDALSDVYKKLTSKTVVFDFLPKDN